MRSCRAPHRLARAASLGGLALLMITSCGAAADISPVAPGAGLPIARPARDQPSTLRPAEVQPPESLPAAAQPPEAKAAGFVTTAHVRDYEAQLRLGARAWARARDAAGNTYWYVRRTASLQGDFYETLVAIERGRVALRAYRVGFTRQPPAPSFPTRGYVERGGQSGLHAHGHQARTMEQLYSACRGLLRSRRGAAAVGLNVRAADGVIDTCSVVRRPCVRDCATGYDLARFGFGPPPAGELEAFVTR